MSLPEFVLESLTGEQIKLSEFVAKAYLVVNTASHCAFTAQYAELEALHREFAGRGLVILGFPCDQFGHQEPGQHQEIAQFCQKNYGVSFPMFAKTNVNGKDTHPLYKYLKAAAPGILGSEAIKWNFTKFLISADASRAKRYAPQTSPMSLSKEIENYLS